MVRLTDAARIAEGKQTKKSRAARAAPTTCAECGVVRWQVDGRTTHVLVGDWRKRVPVCVGCECRRSVERRKARAGK